MPLQSLNIGVFHKLNGAFAPGSNSEAFGTSAVATHDNSVVLGNSAVTTAAGQFIVGSGTAPITAVYLGRGVTNATPDASLVINATGGVGTDIIGSALVLAGGKGTGDGSPGDVLLQTSTTLGSGATSQTLTTRVTVNESNALFAIPVNIGSSTSAVATGDLSAGDGTSEFIWDASIARLTIAEDGLFPDTVSGNLILAASLPLIRFRGSDDTSGIGPTMVLTRTRGTVSVPSAVLSGNLLGEWQCQGATDATPNMEIGGSIKFFAEGNFTGSSSPTAITFWTSPAGSTTPVERWRVNSTGHLLTSAANLDIGTTSANRPTNVYVETSVVVAGVTTTNSTGLSSTGTLTIAAGSGDNDVVITGGPGSGSKGGDLIFSAGLGNAGNAGGNVNIQASEASGAATGGSFTALAGRGGSTSGDGGAFTCTSGLGGSTAGASGAATFSTGTTTNGVSGVLTLITGNALGGTNASGNIVIDTGTSGGRTPGTISLGVTHASAVNIGGGAAAATTTISSGTGAMTFTAGGIFDVNATGAATIDGASGSRLSATGGLLTISTITSGNIFMDSVGTAQIDCVGQFTVDSDAGVSLNGGSASQFVITGGNLLIQTVTSGLVGVTSATAFNADAVTGISLDASNASASNFTLTNTTAATSTVMTIACNNTGATSGDATIDIDANSTNGSAVIDIGTTNVDVINIGNATGSVVYGDDVRTYRGSGLDTFQQGELTSLTDGSATTVFSVVMGNGDMAGVTINYTIQMDDATEFQAENGTVHIAIVDDAGGVVAATPGVTAAQAVSSGTLAVTWTVVTTDDQSIEIQCNANSSLTTTTSQIRWLATCSGDVTLVVP